MTDRYDRFDKHEGGGGIFLMGLLTGAVVGVGLGMLFAPKAGSALRDQLSEQAGALANQAKDGYRKVTEHAGRSAARAQETAGDLADRGKDLYGRAREAVSRGADEAQRYVREAAAPVAAATSMPETPDSTGGGPRRS